jgi:hypothetical protein
MSHPIQAAVALDGIEDRDRIEAIVLRLDGVEVAGMMDSGYGGLAAVPEPDADVLVIACGQASETAVQNVETAVRSRPNRPVVVLFDGAPNGLVNGMFEAGAADIFALPESAAQADWRLVTDQLAFTAEYGIPWLALRPTAGAEETRHPSPIVVDNLVFGLPPIPVREFRQEFRSR